jgi:hypothetical protein
MDAVCYAKKKDGKLCNTKLTEKNKHEIEIENRIYFVCGRHKRIGNTEDIDISKYVVADKIDNKDDIINEFNKKLNIINGKNHEVDENKKTDKEDRKKPCLQYIIYLISKENSDMCQFEDCQFAHNINIVYTNE